MHFAQPYWILIGIFVCIALLFTFHYLGKKRTEALQTFASQKLLGSLTRSVSLRKRKIKDVLLLMSIFCCFVAMARPQYGSRWIDVKRKGIDILFAFDTSKSMLAEDIHPNRMERAKLAVIDFVNQLDGDRVGLMPFAGSSYLMCPLTIDYDAFTQSLQEMDTDIIPTPGTDIAQAVDSALKVLNNDANHKLLVIITDGENLDGNIEKALQKAASAKMLIFTVGVGTAKGELIPINENGKTDFVKDPSGNFVRSKLDETTLKKIADRTGGMYAPLGNRGQGLESIYKEKLTLIPKDSIAEKRRKVPIERFPWPVGAGLFFYIASFLTTTRRRKKNGTTKGHTENHAKTISKAALLFMLPFLLIPVSGRASTGEKDYINKEYLKAQQYYEKRLKKDPENDVLNYNLGTTDYKNNLYDQAIEHFDKALKSKNLDLQEKAYYNLGNVHYKKGEASLKAKPDETVKEWEEALKNYKASMELNSSIKAAQENHDLVAKRLEELKQQQQQKQNQQNQQQDNKDQKNQKDNKQGQSGQSQEKDDKKEDNKQQNDSSSSKKQPGKEGDQQNEQRQKQQDKGDKQNQQSQQASQDTEKKNDTAASAGNSSPEPVNKNKETAADKGMQTQHAKGQLSKEEAKQLLDELKNEEGMLHFVPQKDNDSSDTHTKNW